MDWSRQCLAVIPCFNEARHIGDVVRDVSEILPRIIVVDDGSTDRTAETARACGAEVLSFEKNLGKGAALRAGIKRARELGFDWAIVMDGDRQHSAADIPAFFSVAEKSAATLVVGNRMTDVAPMPWLRRFVNRWMSRRLSESARFDIPDSQCGFRLVNLEAFSGLAIETNRFEIESEMLTAFLSAGKQVQFVPVQTIYKSEASKINPVRDAWRWFVWFWKISRRRKFRSTHKAPQIQQQPSGLSASAQA